MGRSFEEDPLTLAIAPPADETPEQRYAREVAEAEARKVSDEIDEQLKREREGEKRKKKPVKLLLLGTFLSVPSTGLLWTNFGPVTGQSESGKTATLKSSFVFLLSLRGIYSSFQTFN